MDQHGDRAKQEQLVKQDSIITMGHVYHKVVIQMRLCLAQLIMDQESKLVILSDQVMDHVNYQVVIADSI